MPNQTMWERMRSGSKSGFDKVWQAADKLGGPVNRLSNKLGSEAFWPTTLDKESDKAARILKSFCKDGFYQEKEFQPQDGPRMKQRVIQKIPEKVIQRCKGLAIFTTMRTGLWISGAGGSGVVVARKEDGSWSPPTGILLHTAGLGFLVGVDIYDCVIVINTEEAMQAFTRVRCTLGAELSAVVGPVGAGGILDTELHRRQAPIYTYMKSRGFYAGVQIDGSIIIERNDENERFYGYKYSALDILSGKVRHPPYEIEGLMETLKAAQGDSNFNEELIPNEPPPGDYEVDDHGAFGIPDKDDPDPYGVLALEKEGMSLKEAGTNKRASWEQFSFQPSPSSPVHSMYARQSEDKARPGSRRSSWRISAFSGVEPKTPSSLRNSTEQTSRMVDSSTQTEFGDAPLASPVLSSFHSLTRRGSKGSGSSGLVAPMQNVPEDSVLETQLERSPQLQQNGFTTPPRTPPTVTVDAETPQIASPIESNPVSPEPADQPRVHTIIQSATPQVINRPQLVTIPKRGPPPKLPPRNPGRSGPLIIGPVSKPSSLSDTGADARDASPSPTKAHAVDSVHSAEEIADQPLAALEPVPVDVPTPLSEATPLEQKLVTVDLNDDADAEQLEDDDIVQTDPWAKVEETKRKLREQERKSAEVTTKKSESEADDASRMPGGFDA